MCGSFSLRVLPCSCGAYCWSHTSIITHVVPTASGVCFSSPPPARGSFFDSSDRCLVQRCHTCRWVHGSVVQQYSCAIYSTLNTDSSPHGENSTRRLQRLEKKAGAHPSSQSCTGACSVRALIHKPLTKKVARARKGLCPDPCSTRVDKRLVLCLIVEYPMVKL